MDKNSSIKSFFIRLYFTAKMAGSGLVSNLLRTALTVLGIAIGVASVVSLMGIGEGARKAVVEQFESLGQNVIVMKTNTTSFSFSSEEHNDIMERIEEIQFATPVIKTEEYVKWRRTRGEIEVLGVNHMYPIIKDHEIISGNFFSSLHVAQRSPVCVLGYNVAVSLLNGRSPVGQSISINNLTFRIIGVMTPKGKGKGDDIDNQIIVPYSTSQKLNDKRNVDEIWGKSSNEEDTALAIVQLGRVYSRKINGTSFANMNNEGSETNEGVMGEVMIESMVEADEERVEKKDDIFSKGEDIITITSLNQLVEEADDANRIMTLLLGGIAAVSLLVGGLGIMNIMLVAVSERTGEIGVRRALGAKKSDLLFQFILEAFYVSIIGCLVGIIVGVWLINVFEANGFEAVISFEAVKISTVVALTSGLLFGVYPAFLASNLPPVEALRRQ